MTDRVRTLTVVLDRDLRVDDAQAVIAAIKQLRFVSDVEEGRPVDFDDHLARDVARQELRAKLWELLSS